MVLDDETKRIEGGVSRLAHARADLRAHLLDPVDRAATLASVRAKLFEDSSDADVADPRAIFGRYRVVRRIAAGGVGVVYEGYDPDLDRRVAIKLVKVAGARDLDESATRLRLEAQALAKVRHPNVVAVYDVGTYDETDLGLLAGAAEPLAREAPGVVPQRGVYIVMEFVSGRTLREAIQDPPAWRRVLGWLVQAGRGLAAAHAAGVIHRDFKPDNVLICGEGVRVVDFGLARVGGLVPVAPKAVQGSSTRGPVPGPTRTEVTPGRTPSLTQTGLVMGTPAYMSPEQHAGAAVGPASDQFSYCVTAFEVLAGYRPFASKSLDGLARAKQSVRVLAPPPGSKVPRRIWAALARGMASSPDDRFSSMDALLRVLEQDPRRWAARVGIVALTLGVGAALASVAIPDADACGAFADSLDGSLDETSLRALEARLGSHLDPTLAAVLTRRLREYALTWTQLRAQTCRDLVEAGPGHSDDLPGRVACLDRHLEELRAASRLLRDGPRDTLLRAGEIVDSLDSPHSCLDPDRVHQIPLPPPGQGRTRVLDQLSRLEEAALLRTAAADLPRRRELTEAAVRDAAETGHEPLRAEALIARGAMHWDADELERAERDGREAWAIAEREGLEMLAARAMRLVAGVEGKGRGHYGPGLRTLEPAIARLERIDARGEDLARALRLRAVLQLRAGDLDASLDSIRRAAELIRAAYPDEPTQLLPYSNVIGTIHLSAGRLGQAAHEFETGLEIAREAYGESSPRVAMLHNNLGAAKSRAGNTKAACRHHAEALRGFELAYPDGHRDVAMSLNNVAMCSAQAGRIEEAIEQMRRSLEIKIRILGADHDDVGYARLNLGSMYRELGQLEKARAELDDAVRVWSASRGRDHPLTLSARAVRALVRMDAGDRESARVELKEVAPGLLDEAEIDLDTRIEAAVALAVIMGPEHRDAALDLLSNARSVLEAAAMPDPELMAAVEAATEEVSDGQ